MVSGYNDDVNLCIFSSNNFHFKIILIAFKRILEQQTNNGAIDTRQKFDVLQQNLNTSENCQISE